MISSSFLITKRLLQVVTRRHLPLGDVEKHVWDLEDIVEVLLDAGAVFEDLVFVARQLEALLCLTMYSEQHVCVAGGDEAHPSSSAPRTHW